MSSELHNVDYSADWYNNLFEFFLEKCKKNLSFVHDEFIRNFFEINQLIPELLLRIAIIAENLFFPIFKLFIMNPIFQLSFETRKICEPHNQWDKFNILQYMIEQNNFRLMKNWSLRVMKRISLNDYCKLYWQRPALMEKSWFEQD